MPVIAEQHTWSAMPGGYQCLTCSALISDSQIQSNDSSAPATQVRGLNDVIEQVWNALNPTNP